MKVTIENVILSVDKANRINKGFEVLSLELNEAVDVLYKDVIIHVPKPQPSIDDLDDIGQICIVSDPEACCDEEPTKMNTPTKL